ncbi:hypothetical protein ABBQ38_011539 [Trebouxia sp. C0009 RCD-2024]
MLGTPDELEWKSYRKTLSLAFSPENMRKAYPRIYEAALQGSKALQQIYKQGPVDMSDLATRLTAEVISAVGFDQELAALQVEAGPDGKPYLPDQPFLQCPPPPPTPMATPEPHQQQSPTPTDHAISTFVLTLVPAAHLQCKPPTPSPTPALQRITPDPSITNSEALGPIPSPSTHMIPPDLWLTT